MGGGVAELLSLQGKSDSLDTENVHQNQGSGTPAPFPPILGISVQMRIIVPVAKELTGHQKLDLILGTQINFSKKIYGPKSPQIWSFGFDKGPISKKKDQGVNRAELFVRGDVCNLCPFSPFSPIPLRPARPGQAGSPPPSRPGSWPGCPPRPPMGIGPGKKFSNPLFITF